MVAASLPARQRASTCARESERRLGRGLRHRELPVFSVQYHPEGCPGPQDNQTLFDDFLDGWSARPARTEQPRRCWSSARGRSSSARPPSSTTPAPRPAGRCARRAYTTVLVNSNPATIMTDAGRGRRRLHRAADVEFAGAGHRARAARRRCSPTLGGQTGLNLAVELADAGVLDRYDVRLLGHAARVDPHGRGPRAVQAAARARSASRSPTASIVAHGRGRRRRSPHRSGLPLIVRPAFTLGGTGGGIAHTLRPSCARSSRGGLAASPDRPGAGRARR